MVHCNRCTHGPARSGQLPDIEKHCGVGFQIDPGSGLRQHQHVSDTGFAPSPLPDVDLDGRRRIIGSAPDLGAYEIEDVLFVDGFDES
jgi:hypothetical protein